MEKGNKAVNFYFIFRSFYQILLEANKGIQFDEDTTSTSTPAAPSRAPPDAPPLQAPPSGPITRARARELNFVMLLKNEGPEE